MRSGKLHKRSLKMRRVLIVASVLGGLTVKVGSYMFTKFPVKRKTLVKLTSHSFEVKSKMQNGTLVILTKNPDST